MIIRKPRGTGDLRFASFVLLLAGAMAPATMAQAQGIIVDSIQPSRPDLGVLVSAAQGDTVFRISPSDGWVTRESGQGTRHGGGMVRALVSLTCREEQGCEDTEAIVTISAIGNPVGRAGMLTAFTVAPGPAPPIMGPASGTDILTFTVSGIPRNEVRDFYVGADFTLLPSGDTGEASAEFSVSVDSDIMLASFSATTLRPLSVMNTSPLNFGRIIPPSSGSGTVVLNAATRGRELTGNGTVALNTPAPSLAEFEVSGEGGQSISIDVPTSFSLTGPAGSLSVTTNHDAHPSPTLDAAMGSEGSYVFRVGGSIPLSDTTGAGHYSGTFEVTVAYN